MRRLLPLVTNERGVALTLALLIILTLSGLVVAFLSASAFEPQISRNLADVTRARHVAEAGIELGYNTLVGSTDWSTLLAGATCTQGAPLLSGAPLPGLATAAGTVTVTVRNDCRTSPSDAVQTGEAIDPGGATSDTNSVVILTSAGTFEGVTRSVSVVVRRRILPPLNGALAFPGREADVSFSGNSFDIWGTDTNLDGTAGSAPPVYGIAVSAEYPEGSPGANEATVEAALAANQQNRVRGRDEANPAGTANGVNAINADPEMTSASVQDFIAAAKANANIVLESTQSNPLDFQNIGSSCASDWYSQTCWGTTNNPKIVYIKGSPPDPTSAFRALELSGNTTGSGILIVEDGDLVISGNFRWEGVIIVTGQYVGVGFLGGGWQEVLGAVVTNETAPDEAPGYREGVVTGNAKIRYSKQGVDLARFARNLVSMTSWREM